MPTPAKVLAVNAEWHCAAHPELCPGDECSPYLHHWIICATA